MSEISSPNKQAQSSDVKRKKREYSGARSQRDVVDQAMRTLGLLDGIEHAKLSLEQRAQYRHKQQLKTQQKNLEQIFSQAQSSASSDAAADELDPDWLHQFACLAEQIHTPSMQRLWAHIFAMESRQPGSFSVKALKQLHSLTQREANLFQRACGLCSTIGNGQGRKIITGCKSVNSFAGLFASDKEWKVALSQFGLPYSAIMTLADNGLLFANELESGEFPSETTSVVRYNGEPIQLKADRPGTRLTYYRLTPIGDELAQLLPNKVDSKYLHTLVEILDNGFETQP